MAVARAKEKQRDAGVVEQFDTKPLDGEFFANTTYQFNDEELASRRIVAGNNNIAESEIFRLLRTRVLSQMKANRWKTIAVSAPSLGQGKSMIVANLALAMSMEVSQSVLAVDIDLRRPNLHRAFGFEPQKGLADILDAKATVNDTLVNFGSNRLAVLPGIGSVSDSSERLSGPSMQKLFAEFRSRNKTRYVIYDAPPILKSDDVLKSVKNFDCLLLVVEDGKNTTDEIRRSMEVLTQTNFVGYVVNKADAFGLMIGSQSASA